MRLLPKWSGRLEGLGACGEGRGPPRSEPAFGGLAGPELRAELWVERGPRERGTPRL